MTDKEVIKALECCNKDDCDNCPNDFGNCYANLAGYALDLTNRQKAEIERLRKYYFAHAYDECHNEAIKEFAERLKKRLYDKPSIFTQQRYIVDDEIDNLVKEMTGGGNDG